MKGYFYILLVTSICASLCSAVVSSGFEKYIKYIASLICVIVMVSPLKNIDISQITESAEKEFEAYRGDEDLLYKTSGELTEERAKDYIEEMIFNKFGIKPLSVNIEIDWGKEEPTIDNITILLSKNHYPKALEIKDYLFTILGGEVEINEA